MERTFKTNTYGAPVASIIAPDNIDNHRYRNLGDPINVTDKGASVSFKPSALYKAVMEAPYKGLLDAHSCDNFPSNKNKSHYNFQTDVVDLLK
jgi:hypothetical protein